MKIIKREENNNQLANTAYSPVRDLFEDFFRMPSLMDEMFSRTIIMPNYYTLNADVWEEDENFFVKMALPGVSKDDVVLEIESDIIRIQGGKKVQKEDDKNKKYYFRSMETHFEQTFNLPKVVDAEKAEAKFKDGVLEVKLPKAEQYKPKRISIKEG